MKSSYFSGPLSLSPSELVTGIVTSLAIPVARREHLHVSALKDRGEVEGRGESDRERPQFKPALVPMRWFCKCTV